MVEEGVKALRVLFSERDASFDGKYYKFKDVELFPKPKQQRSADLFRWQQSSAPAAHGHVRPTVGSRLAMPQQNAAAMVGELREMTEAVRPKVFRMQVAPQYIVHSAAIRTRRWRGSAKARCASIFSRSKSRPSRAKPSFNPEDINLIGSVETVIARATALRAAGVTHFLGLLFAANSVSELLDQMQMFAEEVRPKIS